MFNVSQKLTSLFTDIANAIRQKYNISEKLKADDFPDLLEGYINGLEVKLDNKLQMINSNVDSIRAAAFMSYNSLVKVNFPSCMTIGNSAFAMCTKLVKANFPSCVNIGNNAFS